MENSKKVSENVKKVAQALGYLLTLDDNHKMERVRLIKLLWAADRIHIRRYGRTITDFDDYYAMVHGPVCSLALDIAQLHDNFTFKPADTDFLNEHFTANNCETSMQKSPGEDYLSESEKNALREAWEMFRDIKTFDLADKISHNYPEWKRFDTFFQDKGGRQKINIEDFFQNPKHDKYFVESDEQLEAAHALFLENYEAEKRLTALLKA